MLVLEVEEDAAHTERAEDVLADGDDVVGVERSGPVEEAYSEEDEDG